jgi:uncharacterized membrane protein
MKTRIILTSLLVTGLMVMAVLLSAGIVLSFGIDIKYHIGVVSPVAFVIAAIIFGFCTNKAIERLKKIWE